MKVGGAKKTAKKPKKPYCLHVQMCLRRGIPVRSPCDVKWPSNPENWCSACGKYRERVPQTKSSPGVVMWQGFGILYPDGLLLQAYSCKPDYVLTKYDNLKLYEGRLRKCRLVMVTARLEKVTRRQMLEAARAELGLGKQREKTP